MIVERGQPWGRSAPLPVEGIVVASDAEARAVVADARRTGRPIPPLGLVGGDLCRTLGGVGDERRLRSPDAVTFPVDLGTVALDGRHDVFVAHLVARRVLWWGRALVAMNAEWLGDWDLGPRSHPNDGRLDITDGDLPLGDRLQARRRARTGTHLPHPALRTSRVAELAVDLGRATPIRLDGETVGTARHVVLGIEPDALTVVV